MRISIKDGGRQIRIPFPAGLVLNGLTAGIAARTASEYGVEVTPAQMRKLFRVIRECKRQHPDWDIVDVQRACGQRVNIKL